MSVICLKIIVGLIIIDCVIFYASDSIQMDTDPHFTIFNTSFWWGAPYLISDELKALVVEPKLGGMFYEDWDDGAGAIWGTVTQWKKNEIFEFTGKCGMGGAVNGVICFTLEGKGSSTLLKLEHDAVGHVTEKTQSGYTHGWNDLLEKRLKTYVEKGECHGIHKK